MQTSNPFDAILVRLDQIQTTVNLISNKSNPSAIPPAVDPERLVNLTEAAALVKKPVATVRHYIHHRNLPATKIGKSYLIKVSELMKWVDEFGQRNLDKNSNHLQLMLENRKRYGKK